MIGYKIVKVSIRPQQLHIDNETEEDKKFLLVDKLGLADEISAAVAAYDALVCSSKKHAAVLQWVMHLCLQFICLCWECMLIVTMTTEHWET